MNRSPSPKPGPLLALIAGVKGAVGSTVELDRLAIRAATAIENSRQFRDFIKEVASPAKAGLVIGRPSRMNEA